VDFPLLNWILREEGPHFQQVSNRWRPVDLLFFQQEKMLLHDMLRRYRTLEEAGVEIRTLNRADKYITKLTRMRLLLRQAHFAWRGNHLTFLEAVAGFYSEYGAVLWLLKTDQARGALSPGVKDEKEGV
jgi:superfamily I DNA/RNA helicase